MERSQIRKVLEAALLATHEPLTVNRLEAMFDAGELPEEGGRALLRDVLNEIEADLEGHGYELKRVASGYRFQVRQDLSEWVSRLWDEKPPRYSRALLETLALIAYRQPVTRGDIEQVRGVSVSPNIMRTLLERGWVRVVGQREVPGRPSIYATTKAFLDYFNLRSLDELPPLSEIKTLIDPVVAMADDPVAAGSEPDQEAELPAGVGAVTVELADDATSEQPQLAEVVRLPTAD